VNIGYLTSTSSPDLVKDALIDWKTNRDKAKINWIYNARNRLYPPLNYSPDKQSPAKNHLFRNHQANGDAI